jgi:PhnB protein
VVDLAADDGCVTQRIIERQHQRGRFGGAMKLNPQLSLSFNGQCEAAFRCYATCLNGEIAFMLRWGDSPAAAEVPSSWHSNIYHATLNVGGFVIIGSDQPSDRYEQPRGFELVLQMDDPVAAERVFNALADGGTIKMPLQETFWASRFGVLIDRFGVRWSINCEPALEPAGQT